MEIEWKQMPDDRLKDIFLVSNTGQVKRNSKDKLLKASLSHNGYRLFATKVGGRSGKYVTVRIARMVAMAFIPNPDNKPQVNHIDGDKLNDSVGNLEWVTNQENTIHAIQTGLLVHPTGYKSKHSKLTKEQEEYCKENYVPRHRKFGARALGRKFGVHHNCIVRHVENGKVN